MAIVRDSNGIIVQQPEGDGGDSAFTTGIMAFSGSSTDIQLMRQFITPEFKLVRHPYQFHSTGTAPHNDPASISRDQVLAYFAGACYILTDRVQKACLGYASNWFVNSDILLPVNRVYLYKLARVRAPLYLYPLAYVNLTLHLVWTKLIAKDTELNQTALMCAVYGPKWLRLLHKLRPDLYTNINDYFSGWRSKSEIGTVFINELYVIEHN